MWIPYGLPGQLKAESAPETVRRSRADTAERDILVSFFLRNPATEAWEVDVTAETATGIVETTIAGAAAVIGFYGNDAGKLNEVIYRLQATCPLKALAACHRDVEERLSRCSLELGRGLAVAGWRLADPLHGARWRCTPFRPSALAFDPASPDATPESHRRLVALYRDARNAGDPAWRLLCARAILRAWREREEPFASTDRRAAQAGAPRRDRVVSFDMLVHSGALACAPDLQDRPFESLVDRLDDLCAGVLDSLDGRPGDADPIGLPSRPLLAQMANLADLAAREVLMEELALCRSQELALAP